MNHAYKIERLSQSLEKSKIIFHPNRFEGVQRRVSPCQRELSFLFRESKLISLGGVNSFYRVNFLVFEILL